MILGTLGVATIWEAVFADADAAPIAVINAARSLRGRKLSTARGFLGPSRPPC
ncbi:MAG: hypothetical protein AB1374_08825 [Bacillota bacterium]